MDYIWVLDYIKYIKYLTINYIQICKYLLIILLKIMSKLYEKNLLPKYKLSAEQS